MNKYLIAFFAIFFQIVLTQAAGQPIDNFKRRLPRDEANRLLQEITQGGKDDAYNGARRSLAGGRGDVVTSLLRTQDYDLKRTIIQAIVDAKYLPGIEAMFDELEYLGSLLEMGGAEVHVMRLRTSKQLEEGLIKMTGLEIDPRWSPEERRNQIGKKVASLKKPPLSHNPMPGAQKFPAKPTYDQTQAPQNSAPQPPPQTAPSTVTQATPAIPAKPSSDAATPPSPKGPWGYSLWLTGGALVVVVLAGLAWRRSRRA